MSMASEGYRRRCAANTGASPLRVGTSGLLAIGHFPRGLDRKAHGTACSNVGDNGVRELVQKSPFMLSNTRQGVPALQSSRSYFARTHT